MLEEEEEAREGEVVKEDGVEVNVEEEEPNAEEAEVSAEEEGKEAEAVAAREEEEEVDSAQLREVRDPRERAKEEKPEREEEEEEEAEREDVDVEEGVDVEEEGLTLVMLEHLPLNHTPTPNTPQRAQLQFPSELRVLLPPLTKVDLEIVNATTEKSWIKEELEEMKEEREFMKDGPELAEVTRTRKEVLVQATGEPHWMRTILKVKELKEKPLLQKDAQEEKEKKKRP
eukprot:TRINITY_DN1814_c0_g1_i2.p1 TRINITY_DN1814_c0_g1~~TRINITY_DN1814_c0_g1_i2.p1  ORF type:complete len:229 (+),score=85.03 TRINITY_DN1814_c0_g1_i2:360-1046(+)